MTVWEPWQTALPAGVALCVAAVGLWRARGAVRLAPGTAWAVGGVFVVALIVRALGLPLERHIYDGHEAEYHDIYLGVRAVSRGGTVLYPAMQWLWALVGLALPAHPAVPLALMIGVGALGAGLSAWTALRWTGGAGAVAAGLLVATHPAHVAWSASAYNVVLPVTLGAFVLATAAAIGAGRAPPPGVGGGGGGGGGGPSPPPAATRLELAIVAAPAGLLVIAGRFDGPRPGPPARRWLGPLLPPLAAALVLAAACAWPLVVPGGLPGAGEHGIAACVHRGWAAPFRPWDSLAGALAAGLIGVGALLARPAAALALGTCPVLVHLVMGTFDDYADRHALIALPAAAALGGLSTCGRGRALGVAGVALGLALQIRALPEIAQQYYATEESFTDALAAAPALSELPRWSLAEARVGCGWINEDPRAADTPARSHFNLLDPGEADSLRGPGGCLRWCRDLQDARWSSRGVQDRALRLAHLYRLQEVAVVEDPGSGYACVVVEVGPRLRCPAPAPGGRGRPAAPTATSPPGMVSATDPPDGVGRPAAPSGGVGPPPSPDGAAAPSPVPAPPTPR